MRWWVQSVFTKPIPDDICCFTVDYLMNLFTVLCIYLLVLKVICWWLHMSWPLNSFFVIRVQLGECLKTMVHADYPEQWPLLLHWIKHNLQDQQVYGALFVLRILTRKYEWVLVFSYFIWKIFQFMAKCILLLQYNCLTFVSISSWDLFSNYCRQFLLRKFFNYFFVGSCALIVHFQYSFFLRSPWELMWILYAMWCRFKSDEERTPVYHIVEETFPHLLNIFNKLVQIANPAIEVADLIKLICKIFWSSIYVCFLLLCWVFFITWVQWMRTVNIIINSMTQKQLTPAYEILTPYQIICSFLPQNLSKLNCTIVILRRN